MDNTILNTQSAQLSVESDREREIRRLAAEGMSQHEIARRTKVAQPYISLIVRNKIYPPRE